MILSLALPLASLPSMTWILLFILGMPPSDLIWMAEKYSESLPKISFQEESGRWTFKGELDRLEDKLVIDEMCERADGKFLNQTRLSDDLLNDLRSQLQEISKDWPKPVQLIRKNRELYLRSKHSRTELEQLKVIYPSLKQDRSSTRRQDRYSTETVFIELAFVELRKEAVEKLGLRFGSPIEFGTSVYLQKLRQPSNLFQVSGGNPVGSFLDLAIREGKGRVHFKQSLVTRNKKKAQFEIGGEYAVRLSSENYSQIGKINYGIKLNFLPDLISSSNLSLELEADIREPDLRGGIDGLPLIQSKYLQTQLVTKLSETMAIGGFIRAQRINSTEGIPVLSEIPVFGRLFSSKDFLENKTEAYLFITPRLLNSNWIPPLETAP